jgi:hypothetical protein
VDCTAAGLPNDLTMPVTLLAAVACEAVPPLSLAPFRPTLSDGGEAGWDEVVSSLEVVAPVVLPVSVDPLLDGADCVGLLLLPIESIGASLLLSADYLFLL